MEGNGSVNFRELVIFLAAQAADSSIDAVVALAFDKFDTEYRFKLYVPQRALDAGHSAVAALATSAAEAFREILASRDLLPFLASEES